MSESEALRSETDEAKAWAAQDSDEATKMAITLARCYHNLPRSLDCLSAKVWITLTLKDVGAGPVKDFPR